MAVEFTATARRLGIFSAVGVVVLGVAYAVTLAVGFLSLESPQQPIGDPMFSILEVLIIVMMPVIVALMVAVHEYLQRHPEMCVLCIVDRETVVAATKFVLCRTDWFKRYEARLLEAYKDNVWPLGADFEPHWCLVLSLDTKLAAIV